MTMDSSAWDDRYRAKEMLWSRGPNVFVEDRLADVEPGVGLDLASGEGRNAIWLAERGWDMTAVDFSSVAAERGRSQSDKVSFVVADVFEWEPEWAVADGLSTSAAGSNLSTVGDSGGVDEDNSNSSIAAAGGVDEDNSNLSTVRDSGGVDEDNSNLSTARSRGFDLILIAYLQVEADPLADLVRRSAHWLRPGGQLFLVGHDISNIEDGVGGPQVPDRLWDVNLLLEWVQGLEVIEAGVVQRPVEVDGDVRHALDTLVRVRAPATAS